LFVLCLLVFFSRLSDLGFFFLPSLTVFPFFCSPRFFSPPFSSLFLCLYRVRRVVTGGRLRVDHH
jgi:hypothetical protein